MLLSVLMIITMAVIMPQTISAAEYSGNYYRFDSETGVLRISSYEGSTNWQSDGRFSQDDILEVYIDMGMEDIHANALYFDGSGCPNLTRISFSEVFYRIPTGVFQGCGNFNEMIFRGNLPLVDTDAFLGVASSGNIYYQLSNDPTQDDINRVTPTGWTAIPIEDPPFFDLTPDEVTTGIVGFYYNQTLALSSTIQPVTASVTAGSLPPGTQIVNHSRITGTPTAAGEYPVTITAFPATSLGYFYRLKKRSIRHH